MSEETISEEKQGDKKEPSLSENSSDYDDQKDISEEKDGNTDEVKEASPSRKKIVILVFLSVFFISILAGSGSYFLFFSSKDAEEEKEPEKVFVYVEFPEIVVDLQSRGKRANFLKLNLVMHVESSGSVIFEEKKILILDKFRSYIRGLDREDLAGQAGTERLRQGLLKILYRYLPDIEISQLLFKEIIVH